MCVGMDCLQNSDTWKGWEVQVVLVGNGLTQWTMEFLIIDLNHCIKGTAFL